MNRSLNGLHSLPSFPNFFIFGGKGPFQLILVHSSSFLPSNQLNISHLDTGNVLKFKGLYQSKVDCLLKMCENWLKSEPTFWYSFYREFEYQMQNNRLQILPIFPSFGTYFLIRLKKRALYMKETLRCTKSPFIQLLIKRSISIYWRMTFILQIVEKANINSSSFVVISSKKK